MAENTGNVLIVDDEPNAVKVLSEILSIDGYRVFKSCDARKALNLVKTESLDAVITDLRMPEFDGMQFFETIREDHPDIPIIFLTGYGTVESAVSTITEGAYYYFIKPPDYTKLKGVLSKAINTRRTLLTFRSLQKTGVLARTIRSRRMNLCAPPPPENGILPGGVRILGDDPGMKKILETVESVRDTTSSVLITGETGTGKELIARALHYGGVRQQRPFVAVNCAAIPHELLESELFGYEKGAFTNAVSRRMGKFEEASSGTILLDEISELSLPLQAKLLRVLQERELERLGGGKKIKVDFRLVSSTNSSLEKDVQAGNFRMDLFYRINVVHISVPPLRKRKGDIPVLAGEFIREFSEREKKDVQVSDEVMAMLCDYSWPGNIRQLRNVLERLVVLSRTGKISLRDVPDELFASRTEAPASAPPVSSQAPNPAERGAQTLRELEDQAVMNALEECRGNKSKAAKMLGISRKTFYKRLKDIGPGQVPA
ncbi:MAG: sigma-54 dependent transcriptional regulator [Nitrospiraceae bacterium]|nr:sigma-54 dependent transcriptional regulator [Nitrospiraceae bacterium]